MYFSTACLPALGELGPRRTDLRAGWRQRLWAWNQGRGLAAADLEDVRWRWRRTWAPLVASWSGRTWRWGVTKDVMCNLC
eukprot:scaffold83_cov246-Pinguiococcus_pyrenoidosus.AAC.10